MSGGPQVQYTKLLQMFIFGVISRKIILNLKQFLKMETKDEGLCFMHATFH